MYILPQYSIFSCISDYVCVAAMLRLVLKSVCIWLSAQVSDSHGIEDVQKRQLEVRDQRQFFDRRAQTTKSSAVAVNTLRRDVTIANFFVRVPTERQQRKIFSDVRRRCVTVHFDRFSEPRGAPRHSRSTPRPQHGFSSIFGGPRAGF